MPNSQRASTSTQTSSSSSGEVAVAPSGPDNSTVQAQVPGADASGRAEAIHQAFHGSWWGEDEEAALRQLSGVGPGMAGAIRDAYLTRYGVALEQEFRDRCSAAQANQALRVLWPALSLSERLRTHVSGGLVWDSANQGGLMDVLRSASVSEQIAAGRDPSVMALLANHLDADQLFQARQLLQPDQLGAAVLERIQAANGFFGDDEDAVMAALMTLPQADRAAFWTQHGASFDFLSAQERGRMAQICTGSEADALAARMEQATDGLGTDDDAVSEAAARAGDLRREQLELQSVLAGTQDPQERARIQARLVEIGDLDGLLDPSSQTMGALQGDLSDSDFARIAGQMGQSEYALARQQILDAVGWISTDEQSIYEAFDRVPEGLRQQLWDDPEIQRVLGGLSESERSDVAAFRDNNSGAMVMQRLEEEWSHWSTDTARIFALVGEMSEGERATFRSSPLYVRMLTGLDLREGAALRRVAETGSIPTDMAVDAALGGSWDGTDEDMLAQTFEAMHADERFNYRLGYWLSRDGREPADPEQEQALADFLALESRLRSELGADDLQTALDQLVGVPTARELETEAGRLMAAGILVHRADDKQALGDGLGAMFTEKDETADGMEVQLDAAYLQALEDGVISAEELAILASLDERFAQRYAESVAAIDMVRNIAATVAAVAAGIVVTALTAGAAGPVVAGLLSTYGAGALAGGVAGAVTRVGVSELMGGDHFDTFSGEGATQAAAGFTDGAMAVLANGLATRFTDLVGLRGAQLSGAMSLGSIEAAGGTIQASGRAFVQGSVRGGLDGLLSGMVGELVLTAADSETWRRGVWDVVIAFGEAALRGGSLGAATGGLVGGGIDALGAYVSRARIESLVQDLESVGIPRQRLDSMPLDSVRVLGQVDAALAAGDLESANQLMRQLGGELETGQFDLLRAKLIQTHMGGDALGDFGLQGSADLADVLAPGFRATPEMQAAFRPIAESPRFRQYFGEQLGPGGVDEWYAALVAKVGADHPAVAALTPEELLAVYGYTTDAYEMLNGPLRNMDPAELEAVMPFLQSATSGLNAMPSVQGVLTRRMDERAVQYIDHLLVEGTVFSDNAFSSSSVFDDLTSFGDRYIIDVRGRTGAMVQDISAFGGEGEVLFAPGARFRVVKRWQEGHTTRAILQEM
ncbi:MAG: ADP-ribosyltransferase [Myxococcota bacterium]|nr:ADP-ribosyltransferase [Myxococcota bacterium]